MVAVGVACVGPFTASAAEAPEKPDVLMIVVDDLRPELGCYGQADMQTPNIDGLAATGMRFDRAYTAQAVCLPSRVSLLTGMRPDSTGVHDIWTDFRQTIPDAVTMPRWFGKHGYRTVGMGKILHTERSEEWTEWVTFPDAKDRTVPMQLAEGKIRAALNSVRGAIS